MGTYNIRLNGRLIQVHCVCGADTQQHRILLPPHECPACGRDWTILRELMNGLTVEDNVMIKLTVEMPYVKGSHDG